jgi:methionyl-tRNA synthetase
VLTLAAKHCDGCVPEPGLLTDSDNELLQAASNALDESIDFVNRQSLHRYCKSVIEVATMGNKYIDTEAPWKLAKTDIGRMKTVLYVLIEVIRRLAIILEPVIPQACCQLLDQAGADESMRTFSSIASKIIPGSRMAAPNPVFPKIDTGDEAMTNAKAALKVPDQKSSSSSTGGAARNLDEIINLIEVKSSTIRQLKVSFICIQRKFH